MSQAPAVSPILDRELERGELRVLARFPEPESGPSRCRHRATFHWSAARCPSGTACVALACAPPGPPGSRNAGKIAQHQKLIAIGSKRAQRRRQLVCGAFEHRQYFFMIIPFGTYMTPKRLTGLAAVLQKQTAPGIMLPAAAAPGSRPCRAVPCVAK